MRTLRHRNILPLTSVFVGLNPNNPCYIISPWAANGNARTFVKGKPFGRRLRVVSAAWIALYSDLLVSSDFRPGQISESLLGLTYREAPLKTPRIWSHSAFSISHGEGCGTWRFERGKRLVSEVDPVLQPVDYRRIS